MNIVIIITKIKPKHLLLKNLENFFMNVSLGIPILNKKPLELLAPFLVLKLDEIPDLLKMTPQSFFFSYSFLITKTKNFQV